MDARTVLGLCGRDTIYTADQPYLALIRLYGQALIKAPYCVDKIIALLKRAVSANEALKWERWVAVVETNDPWDNSSGKPSKEMLETWLSDYEVKNDLPFLENEPDKAFRNRYFKGLDRILLSIGAQREIAFGDLSEHDIDGRIRQGYLTELQGDTVKAKEIYDSVGFNQ